MNYEGQAVVMTINMWRQLTSHVDYLNMIKAINPNENPEAILKRVLLAALKEMMLDAEGLSQ